MEDIIEMVERQIASMFIVSHTIEGSGRTSDWSAI